MFMLRNLSKFVFGDSSKETIVDIPQGQLYLVRPRSVKGYSELIFKDAAATIRRTGQEFQYQLVVQRAYEEGEADLLAEEAGDDAGINALVGDKDEKTFLLDEDLQLRDDERSTGEKIFAWRDLSGDVDDLWEFVCDASVKPETASLFERVALQCQYERKFRRSHEHATEDDLEALAYYKEPIPDASPISSPGSQLLASPVAPPTTEELFPNTTREKMAKQVAGKGGAPAAIEDATAAPPSAAHPAVLEVLTEATAELHLFDFRTGTFIRQDPKVDVTVAEIGDWKYWLHIVGEEREWLGQPVVEDINPVFNYEYKSFIFNHYLDDGSAYSWLLRFTDQEELEIVQQGVMQALWEHLNKVKWGKAKDTDREYVLEAFQDMTMEMPWMKREKKRMRKGEKKKTRKTKKKLGAPTTNGANTTTLTSPKMMSIAAPRMVPKILNSPWVTNMTDPLSCAVTRLVSSNTRMITSYNSLPQSRISKHQRAKPSTPTRSCSISKIATWSCRIWTIRMHCTEWIWKLELWWMSGRSTTTLQ